MARSQDLYRAICDAAGKEQLSDGDIHKIVLFLQRGLCQPGDPVDLGIGEVGYIDSNIL